MRELYNYVDYKSRDAAENIRIAFDENAWNKMKMMLDEDDKNPSVPVISNTSAIVTKPNKNYRWLVLVMLLFFIGIGLVVIKNNYTQKNKALSFVKNNNRVSDKSAGENEADSHVAEKRFIEKHLPEQELLDKNLKPQATFNPETTLSLTTEFKNRSDKKNKPVAKDDDLKVYNDVERNSNNLQLNNQHESDIITSIESSQSELKEININQPKNISLAQSKQFKKEEKDTSRQNVNIVPGVNTKHKHSSSLKNKFFKNIGFSAFIFPEMSSVKFRSSDKVTVGYGAGISYTIGKHFTLQTQFLKTRKVYVTDRKGYNPVAGSPLIPIDTLTVNADCKVWDIPVNLRYNFKSNIKNDFFISAGISSYIMKKEVYDFDYYNRGINEKKQRIIENENKHSFCNLNLSVGYQYWLNKKWSIGFEPYLKLPLTGVGAGKVKLTSAGALFNLTFKPMK